MKQALDILSATRRLILILMAIILFTPTAVALYANEAPPPSDGDKALEALKASLAMSDEYQFTAQIEQTMIPRATTANIGQTEERVDTQLIGTITPEKSTLDMRFEGGGIPNLLLEQVDGQMFLIRDGERTLIDNPLSATAPDGSFAGYLHAATNVVERVNPDFPDYTVYQFEIDGQMFADYLMAEAQANLPTEQQHRVYGSARTASLMSGTGEFWLNDEGILRRQIVEMSIPEATEAYDINAHIVIDYRYEDDTAVIYGLPDKIVPIVPPLNTGNETTTPVQTILNDSPFNLENGFYLVVSLMAMALLVLLLIYLILHRSRELQIVLPFLLTFALVATPLLQVASAEAALNRAPKTQSLLEALGFDDQQEDVAATSPIFNAQASPLTTSEDKCGVSTDRTTDSDGDQLTDFVENCLGTNPYSADTDDDLISDYDEVSGFVFTDTVKGPITYYTNPLEPDSNFDGRSDFYEWPTTYQIEEWKQVDEVVINPWDIDGDNQPDLWDIDDDGDGVYDGLDINPEHVTENQEYFRLNLYQGDNTQPGVYTVIDFQVQPEDLSHLRYSTTPLDWPDGDDKGPIQDIDESTGDLTLTPYLRAYTRHLPTQEMMDFHGITAFSTSVDGWYYMYIPLTPIGDGGRIEAFAGKAVYDMGAVSGDFGWRDTKLVWFANFKQDDGSNNVIAEYEEDAYRFVGLDISRQTNYDFAILGTPNSPDNNRDLYQLMAALDASYLSSLQITLNALTNRFNSPSTPITRTWGIPANDVTVMRPSAAPGYSSAVSVELANSLESYLNTNAYPYDDVASLIVAMQGETGTLSLGEDRDSDVFLDQRTFKAKLYYVPMSTIRSTSMAFMNYGNGGWQRAEPAEVGEALAQRYDVDALAESMQATYPGVDGDKLVATIALTNANFEQGNQVVIKHDDLIMVPIVLDDGAVMEVVEVPEAADIFHYTLDVSGLGVQGEGLAFDSFEGYKLYRYEIPKRIDWTTPKTTIESFWGLIPVSRQALIIDFFRNPRQTILGSSPSQSAVQNDVVAETAQYAPLNTPLNTPSGDLGFDVDLYEDASITKGEIFEIQETPGSNTPKGEVYHEQTLAEELGDVDAIADEDLVVTEGAEDVPDTPEGTPGKKRINADKLDDIDTSGLDIVEDAADASAERFDARYVDDVDDIANISDQVDEDFFADWNQAYGVRQADDVAEAASWFSKLKKVYQTVKKPLQVAFAILDVVGVGVELAFIWLEYANFQSIYEYERNEALAYATAVSIVLFVVTLLTYIFPAFGFAVFALELIFMLTDLIALAFGEKVDSRQEFLRGFFSSIYDADALTKVATMEWRGIRFEEMGSLKAGDRLVLSDFFTGVIQAAYQDTVSHLDQSSSYGYFRVESQHPNLAIRSTFDNSACSDAPTAFYDWAAGYIYTHSKVCRNKLQTTIKFDGPVVNGTFSLQPVAEFKTRYEVCVFDPDGEDCKDKRTDTATLPDELPEENQWDYVDIVMDVLPATLTELWQWSAYNLDGSDYDADGFTYFEETTMFNTEHDQWDSDGDGLSDRHEIYALDFLGVSATKADSDNDGLDDGTELRLGTTIGDPDSDDDGILDGDEVPHYDADTGMWHHGGGFITIDGNDYFVFLSPLTNDLDRDGLSDSNELSSVNTPVTTAHTTALRFNTSPYAVNSNVPSVQFTAEPLIKAPTDQVGVYVSQGDTLTATLQIDDNYASSSVDGIVELCLPDAGLTNTAVQTGGVRTDVTPTQSGNCYSWDFSSNPLQSSEEFTAIVTGIAGTNTAITSAITIDVPYSNIEGNFNIQDSIEFHLDNDAPSVVIYEPMADSELAGDFFVMGGSSSDPSSWVDYVELQLPAGGGTGIATDTAPWAYTWDLPDDGIVTVTAVAYDAVGNASTPVNVQVTVDSLAPVITTSFADGATISAGESYSDTILLSGNVSDNYSGVVRVQMAANNQPWRTIWTSDTPQNGSIPWSGEWQLPAITESAQGEHTLRLRAWDDFGNIGLLEQTVFVDLLPPTNEMTDRRFTAETITHVPLSQALALQGVANDAGRNPVASGPIPLEGTLDSFDDATVWLQPDTHEVDDAGVTVSWIGDYNGDRLADMAISFPNAADGRGKVIIVLGKAGGWPNPNLGEMEQLLGQTPTFIGVEGAGLGGTVVPAGDFNGDGFEDFMIGDLANNRLFLVYGTAVPQGSELLLDSPNTGYWDVIPAGEGETFTTQFGAAGDVNNDSYSDIIIATDTAAYLLSGDRTPIPSLGIASGIMTAANTSVAGVGDVTGDFIDDFAIATGNMVYLFAGGGSWIENGRNTIITSIAVASFATSDASPTLINAGDLNDDGLADFAFSNGTTPVVVFGSDSGSYTTQTLGGFPSDLSGFLASAGDTNKDGLSDLLVGNAAGDAYLLLGGDLTTIAATIENVAGSASAPYTKGADLTGDGSADLLIVPSDTNAFVSGLPQAQPGFIPQNALPQRSVTDPAENAATASGDVTVGDGNADYSSIQAAIDSGASRVLIQPGIYYEAITLTNNITVAGSGAGLTTLMMPEGDSVLITADGVTNTALLNLRLTSETGGIGVSVKNGAAVDMERLLIEEMNTAVSIDGATTNVDLKNNSFIANVNGLSAINCAELDVRNSIFAYNSGTALAYEACAAIQRHEFNLFYANGTDQTPNDPGSGELFSNPLFYSYAAGDYRVEAVSPVINAGSPGDAVPPGAGNRIDIGHLEQSGGSYVASPTYCASCDNDGLIWGVNAFTTIQDAVDAAEEDLLNLFGGDGTQFTVGVAEGTYNESVTIGWNLQLLGSNPDKTTIQGVAGPAVTISATVGTKVSGFTLIGGGASPIGVHLTGGSSGIELTRNLIKNNVTGIYLDERSSGMAQFNTVVSNTTGVLVDGRYNWLDADSNLISGNTNGLFAATSPDQVVGDSGIETRDIPGGVFSDNNLLFNTVDYTNVITGVNDIVGSDPLISGPYALLTLGSPALDEGSIFTAVPSGGGLAPDIGWHELTIPPISVLMGQADDSIAFESYGVGSVEYAIVPVADPSTPVTSTLPISWTAATLTNPGEKLTYWNSSHTPAATGFYRIYSRAVDGLGNAETNSTEWYDGAFYVDDAAPAVSLSYEAPDDMGVENSWLRLTGVVTDYVGTSFDIADIYFTVDGVRYDGRWALDNWEADGVTGRTFHAIYMNTTGSDDQLDIQAFAVDGAGQMGQSGLDTNVFIAGGSRNYYDSTAPRIQTFTIDDGYDTLLPPFANNSLYSGTITFEGTATDSSDFGCLIPNCEAFTGINGYQISFDGGLTWDTMGSGINPAFNNLHNGRILPYDWPIPDRLDATTIPVKIRVTDYDGNSNAFVYTVTVDTGAPRIVGTINLESGPAQGQHLDQTTFLDLSWATPTDGSGDITLLGTFGQTETDIPPTTVLPTSEQTRRVDVSEGGEWYAVVGAEDEVGNVDWMWVGPWHAGQVKDPDAPGGLPWAGAIQSLGSTIADGYVDLANNEYVVENEWLDTDSRGFTPLSLYNAWDSGSSYIGVVGGNWQTDGTFFVYYDLENGGTTMPISATGSIVLPFEADYALVYTGATAQSWQFNGTAWEDDFSALGFGADANSQGMQMGRYFGPYWNLEDAVNHRMVAYALGDDNELWATFPRNNDLGGALAYYYDWNVTPGNGDLLKLPTFAQLSDLAMVVNSDPIGSAPLTHGSVVTMGVSLFNLSDGAVEDVLLDVTGSTGVTYQTVTGATCLVCPPAGAIQVEVAEVAGNSTAVVTLTAQLAADLTGLNTVTTTVALISQSSNNEVDTIVHRLDLSAPIVDVEEEPGNVVDGTLPRLLGSADDRAGIGLARVEFSLDQASWTKAQGTDDWTANLDLSGVSGSTADVYVRAIDLYGQVSEVISRTVVIDDVAPVITPTIPTLVGGSSIAYLTGAASDPAPADAQVASLQIRFDNETTWRTVPLGTADVNGVKDWAYAWQLPVEDGVEHTYQYRAIDNAGNVFTSTLYTTVVDRVSPVLTLDTDLNSLTVENDIITGTVTDGREMSSLNIAIYAITGSGTVTNTAITPNPDGSWSYDLNLAPGSYSIILNASDGLNAPTVIGPVIIDVSDVVISNTLNITATLQGRTSHDVTHSLSFYAVGNTTTAVYSNTATADITGTFTLNNLPSGTYTVTITPPAGHLSAAEVVTIPASGTTSVNFGELKSGDANGDNAVNILDLSILAGAYNTTSGQAGYDARADFNGDGSVNILDLSILAGNYNTVGEKP